RLGQRREEVAVEEDAGPGEQAGQGEGADEGGQGDAGVKEADDEEGGQNAGEQPAAAADRRDEPEAPPQAGEAAPQGVVGRTIRLKRGGHALLPGVWIADPTTNYPPQYNRGQLLSQQPFCPTSRTLCGKRSGRAERCRGRPPWRPWAVAPHAG